MSDDESHPILQPLLSVQPKSIKFQGVISYGFSYRCLVILNSDDTKAEISLTNLTNSLVAFKVKATDPIRYVVKY